MLSKLNEMMRDGRLPDPQSRQGLVVYSLIGIAIGWWLQMNFGIL